MDQSASSSPKIVKLCDYFYLFNHSSHLCAIALFTFMHLAEAFNPKRLILHSGYTFFVSMYVYQKLNISILSTQMATIVIREIKNGCTTSKDGFLLYHELYISAVLNSSPWTLCREHVNRNTVRAWSALLTSWLSESGVLKRDMKNMRGGGLELRASGIYQGSGFHAFWPINYHLIVNFQFNINFKCEILFYFTCILIKENDF